MKFENRKNRRFRFFLFLLCAFLLYILNIYSFLCPNRNTHHDILVVEGWLVPEAQKQAEKEFLNNHYSLILTTGFPYWGGYRVGSNGILAFELPKSIPVTKDSVYTLSVTLRGSDAKGKYAHFKLLADTNLVLEGFSKKSASTFKRQVKLNNQPDSILVVFDNDTYNFFGDRELYVYSIMLNGIELPVSSEHVKLYQGRMGNLHFIRHMNSTTARDAAMFLRNGTIPDSLIIPVDILNESHSRTYSAALAVKNWLKANNGTGPKTITVFSMGPHARRSWLTYKKVFGKDAVGIISVHDRHVSSSSWFRTLHGWKTVLSETAGVTYIWLFSRFW